MSKNADLTHSPTPDDIVQQVSATDLASSLLGSPLSFVFLAIFVLIVAICFRRTKKNSVTRNLLAITGERYAGKTQLFMNIAGGKLYKMSAPSIHQNTTSIQLNNCKRVITDFYGDAICKDEILDRLDQIQCIIHVIDGTDLSNFSDAAMCIYKTLINKKYQSKQCKYLILLNKRDAQDYMGLARAQQKLEDEIEHIKNSKINAGEEDQEGDQDYIKLSKGRFTLPFKMVEGSAHNDIQDFKMTLNEML